MSANLRNAIRAINKSALLYGSISALALSGVANAQEAGLQTEEVVVTGIRAALERALDIKRDATNIVDAISAEDIGKFPDKNVAESLSRIPGVAVSREFGEGEKVTIRGAGPSSNLTFLNGQTIASADWYILDEAVRSFNYTLLPSTLVSTLEVHKTPKASLDEGSIGGTVILRTRRPLELDANSIDIAIEGQYSETSEEFDPQISAQYSWKDTSERFGFLVSATKQDRTLVREGVEILGWPTDAASGNQLPSHIGVPRFEQKRERETFFVSLQARPTEEWDITFNALDSELEAANQNANLLILPNNALAAGDLTFDQVIDGNVVAGTAVVDGNGDGTNGAYTYFDMINRISGTETSSYDLDVTYETDAFKVHGQIGTTEASGGTTRETSWEYTAATGYQYDLTDGVYANVTDIDPSDASEYGAGWIWGGGRPATDEEDYAQLDFETPVEFMGLTSFKTGLKYRDHSRSQDRFVYSWHGAETMPEGESGTYLDYIFNQCPTLAQCGLDDSGTITVDAVVGGNLVEQVAQNRSAMETIAFEGLNGVPADYAVSRQLSDVWQVDEEITAFYVEGDFEYGDLNGNIGVRYVKTDQTSGGYAYAGGDGEFLTLDREWLAPETLEWVEVDNSYNEVLPSLSLKYELTDEQALRFSAARVMARQNYATLSSSTTYGNLNQVAPSGTANNPLLDPQIANQFDVAWEYYFGDTSAVTATYFYKDIKSYISYNGYVEPRLNQETNQMVDVLFNQPINGKGGEISGLELIYQQDFASGFGFNANYTYTDASRDSETDPTVTGASMIPGASEHMANVTGYFENELVSARLTYNYRTEWYKGVHYNGDDLWNDSYGQLDASFSYYLTDHITLSLDAVNLTDEEVVEYNTDELRLMSIYQNGRRVTAGVRMSF